MLWREYNEEETMAHLKEDFYEEGMEKGIEKGIENVNKLHKILMSEKRYDELEKSIDDEEYQNELMKKYKIIE